MKLTADATTFNLGDTSFRRKTLIDDYKVILRFVQLNNEAFPSWDRQSQTVLYNQILKNTTLFNRTESTDLDRRARTLTSALVKLGLLDRERKLSPVASNWLVDNNKDPDTLEQLLGVNSTNLLFFRQLLKLRVYDSTGSYYHYPFRIGLSLLCNYDNIPENHFFTILHLIKPTFSNIEIQNIISDYIRVQNNSIKFFNFLKIHSLIEETPQSAVFDLQTLSNIEASLDYNIFAKYFKNRKSSSITKKYHHFVSLLIDFKKTPDITTLNQLLTVSAIPQIKKAFGFNRSIFNRENTVENFLSANADNILLSGNLYSIFERFQESKTADLINEYSDLTKRTFNLTGIIDFTNGLVNFTQSKIFRLIFADMNNSGMEPYNGYEENLNSELYRDITLSEVLHLQIKTILEEIRKVLNVNTYGEIIHVTKNLREQQLRKTIKEKFPKETIVHLLSLFSQRRDSEIQDIVSEGATVPTIYEYIIAIAWFYISQGDFLLTESMNLTLDGNMLPLSHAAGGAGDIVIHYEEQTVMLEVTLMNTNAQKRGEWEPVLRHATNLTIEEQNKTVITLFIADTLDTNTINIWRAVANVPLQSSYTDDFAEQVIIFPLENARLQWMLDNNTDSKFMLSEIERSYRSIQNNFDMNWREDILEKTLNQTTVSR